MGAAASRGAMAALTCRAIARICKVQVRAAPHSRRTLIFVIPLKRTVRKPTSGTLKYIPACYHIREEKTRTRGGDTDSTEDPKPRVGSRRNPRAADDAEEDGRTQARSAIYIYMPRGASSSIYSTRRCAARVVLELRRSSAAALRARSCPVKPSERAAVLKRQCAER